MITFTLIGGYAPFQEEELRDQFRKIRNAEYEFEPHYWNHVSDHAKNLIRKCLTVDPEQRATAANVLANDEWIQDDPIVLRRSSLMPNLDRFKKENAKRTFKSAVQTIIAVHRFQEKRTSLVGNATGIDLSQILEDE